MTAACSRIEINPMMPVTPTVSLSYNYTTVITELCSNHVAFVEFVGRPQLKNGNLWLKTGSCSASYCSY